MEQINSRTDEMIQYLRPDMEKYFCRSCQFIQTEIENSGNQVWNELKDIIVRILMNAEGMQKEDKKGCISYLIFSFLNCGVYLNKLELRIEVLDDGFYLDEQEAAGYYCPQLIQTEYLSGIECLRREASEKYIRLQEHELFEINKEYAAFYNTLICKMIESLCQMIMETVAESEIKIAEDLKIVYGEYMDKAVVLWAGNIVRREIEGGFGGRI